jgi:hypothetical protein
VETRNEVELIRAQLATERRHAALVAGAFVRALEEESAAVLEGLELSAFCQTCVEYLSWVLNRFEARERSLVSFCHSQDGGAGQRELLEILGRPGTSREALERLETALEGSLEGAEGEQGIAASVQGSWSDFARFVGSAWRARTEAVDEVFGRTATAAEWRSMASIDAVSILDERSRFARVQAAAPPGIELRPLHARP